MILSGVQGCNSDEVIVYTADKYFPLHIGFYQIYEVEEITYTAFNPPVSSTYQLKSEIVDSFINSEGETTYVIHRGTRSSANASWEFKDTWSARLSRQYAIESEGNTSYVKLVFPATASGSWNGNLYNALGEDEYTIESLGTTFSVSSSISFSMSIVVNQNAESNLVFRDERVEVYTPQMGLTYKESKVWEYNCSGGSCSSEINNGRYWKQVLIEYGHAS